MKSKPFMPKSARTKFQAEHCMNKCSEYLKFLNRLCLMTHESWSKLFLEMIIKYMKQETIAGRFDSAVYVNKSEIYYFYYFLFFIKLSFISVAHETVWCGVVLRKFCCHHCRVRILFDCWQPFNSIRLVLPGHVERTPFTVFECVVIDGRGGTVSCCVAVCTWYRCCIIRQSSRNLNVSSSGGGQEE